MLLLLGAANCSAEEIRVAVASNFMSTIKILGAKFEQKTGHRVILSSGSTGKHYAQIIHGAPFHAFFAADTKRPALLEQSGLTQANSRFTYAIGKLALWSPKGLAENNGTALRKGKFRHLAIANPKLAPYGKAAFQVLQARGLWLPLKNKIVRGENIAQTFQFVKSGNADLGFIASSQLEPPDRNRVWLVPQALYKPIRQQAVLIKNNAAAQAFVDYVQSDEAKKIIEESGYSTP